jgi:hypothetical protein
LRNLADLGGLEICYRYYFLHGLQFANIWICRTTNNYPNYLTNMLSLGLSLLSFAIRDLDLWELREWAEFEQGNVES